MAISPRTKCMPLRYTIGTAITVSVPGLLRPSTNKTQVPQCALVAWAAPAVGVCAVSASPARLIQRLNTTVRSPSPTTNLQRNVTFSVVCASAPTIRGLLPRGPLEPETSSVHASHRVQRSCMCRLCWHALPVFSSKFWSDKIYCSILFVFGNNYLTID
jgi:hypothetical protein